MSCRMRVVRRVDALYRQSRLLLTTTTTTTRAPHTSSHSHNHTSPCTPTSLSTLPATWSCLSRTASSTLGCRRHYGTSSDNDNRAASFENLVHPTAHPTAVVDWERGLHILTKQQDNPTRPQIVREETMKISKFWLRDICPCSECHSPSSGQKKFSTFSIDPDVQTKSATLQEDGVLHVEWEDGHVSDYPFQYLANSFWTSAQSGKETIPVRTPWDRATFDKGLESRNIEYSDWMEKGPAFKDAMKNLGMYGLIIVKNVPESEDSVQKIGERIGPLQDTFYGLTWDVISKPDAENVAYTSEFLPLHQDLLYNDPVPRIQLLHCLKNNVSGGDSLFSDGLLAFWKLSEEPGVVDHFEDHVMAYWYTKNGNERYRRHKPFTIRNFGYSKASASDPSHARVFKGVRWSPPFQAPLPFTPTTQVDGQYAPNSSGILPNLDAWIGAIRKFLQTIEDPANMWSYKVQPGDCYVFDNQRILHGRTQFDPSSSLSSGGGGGERHLRGAYLDSQTYERACRNVGVEAIQIQIRKQRSDANWREIDQVGEIYKSRGQDWRLVRKSEPEDNAPAEEAPDKTPKPTWVRSKRILPADIRFRKIESRQ